MDGALPSNPITNGFLVWVGVVVLVVSEGVGLEDEARVAEHLRTLLVAPALPIVFNRGRHASGMGVTIACYPSHEHLTPQMAKAEAYVLVERAWEETEAIVHVGARRMSFAVDFRDVGGGRYQPIVHGPRVE